MTCFLHKSKHGPTYLRILPVKINAIKLMFLDKVDDVIAEGRLILELDGFAEDVICRRIVALLKLAINLFGKL